MSNNEYHSDSVSVSLQAHLSALAFRLGQLLADRDRLMTAGSRLSQVIKSLIFLPEMLELWQRATADFRSIESVEWERLLRRFLNNMFEHLGNFGQITAIADSPAGDDERAVYVIRLLGSGDGFEDFSRRVQAAILELLDGIEGGQLPELEWLDGIFTYYPDYTLALMDMLIDNIDKPAISSAYQEAIEIFKSRFYEVPAVHVAEGIMEQQHGLGKADDADFNDRWQRTVDMTVKRLGRKDKFKSLPKGMRNDEDGDFTEIIANYIYLLLRQRVESDLPALIRDAADGRLTNLLVKSIEHDVSDQIRALTAKKRDVRKDIPLHSVTEDGQELETPLIEGGMTVEEITLDSMLYREMLGLLSKEERRLVLLKLDGYNNAEAAILMGHSPSWATKQLAAIGLRVSDWMAKNERPQ